jgi:hypothetical protein
MQYKSLSRIPPHPCWFGSGLGMETVHTSQVGTSCLGTEKFMYVGLSIMKVLEIAEPTCTRRTSLLAMLRDGLGRSYGIKVRRILLQLRLVVDRKVEVIIPISVSNLVWDNEI